MGGLIELVVSSWLAAKYFICPLPPMKVLTKYPKCPWRGRRLHNFPSMLRSASWQGQRPEKEQSFDAGLFHFSLVFTFALRRRADRGLNVSTARPSQLHGKLKAEQMRQSEQILSTLLRGTYSIPGKRTSPLMSDPRIRSGQELTDGAKCDSPILPEAFMESKSDYPCVRS